LIGGLASTGTANADTNAATETIALTSTNHFAVFLLIVPPFGGLNGPPPVNRLTERGACC
jgi:hypothetical protein